MTQRKHATKQMHPWHDWGGGGGRGGEEERDGEEGSRLSLPAWPWLAFDHTDVRQPEAEGHLAHCCLTLYIDVMQETS